MLYLIVTVCSYRFPNLSLYIKHIYNTRRLQQELDSIRPLNMRDIENRGSSSSSSSVVHDKASTRDLSRADVLPVAVDSDVGFQQVGGLDDHVKALKEMVVLPLLYRKCSMIYVIL